MGGQPLFGKTQEIHLIWLADAALTLIDQFFINCYVCGPLPPQTFLRRSVLEQLCAAGCPEEVRVSTTAQANFYHFYTRFPSFFALLWVW